MKRSSILWSWYVSLVIGCGLVICTGLITKWGEWYASDLTYRRQAEALFHGSFALDSDPGRLTWDMIWSRGKIQQPWGLGVPAWQALFDSFAKIFGRDAFPDRLSFAVAVAFVTYLVLRLFALSPHETQQSAYLQHAVTIVAVLLLVLFPPFVTLCRTRFRMYEEAAAYTYLVGLALFCGIITFTRNPRITSYAILGLLAGLAGFVRPTLVAYSFVTMAIAAIYACKLGWSINKCLLGPLLFALSASLLLLTNLVRFGSAFEFGHQLNLNGVDVMRFVKGFQNPFRTVPLFFAVVDLASSLFLARSEFNGFNYYQLGFFPGQATTIRWREYYFSTYDLSFLIIIIGAAYLFVSQLRQRFGAETVAYIVETRVMAAWIFFSLGLLFVFYVHFPSLSSRYLIDFGPGMAASIALYLLLFKAWLTKRYGGRHKGFMLTLMGFVIWWAIEVFTADIHPAYRSAETVNHDQLRVLLRDIREYRLPPEPLPAEYGLTTLPEHHYGLPFNGDGWDSVTGTTKAAVTLFVRNPELVELVVAPADGAKLSNLDYESVQAKIGLESLKLKYIRERPEGKSLVFEGPKRPMYQSGLQVAYLGFVRAKELDTGNSKFRLLRVRWHRDSI